jgi:hypothetical protein
MLCGCWIKLEFDRAKSMGAADRKVIRVSTRHLGAILWLLLAALAAQAELKPETTAAYQKYIAALDTQMAAQDHSQSGFLWIDQDAGRQQAVRRGEIVTQKVKSFSVPAGMIQHWIGGVFLPGATLAQVERVDQDYADYGKIYGPDVSRVKVLSHDGNHFVISYRITKTKVLTAVMDTVHAIDYIPLGPTRMAVHSRSESVRQVEDAGKPTERDLVEGEGSGFLWAMNSYWRTEERDGGVYVECEAITLSRDVPFGLGALVDPILQSFAEESLKKTIEAKKQAVAARK